MEILQGDAVYCDPGDDVIITCQIDDVDGKMVKWTVDGDEVVMLFVENERQVYIDDSQKSKYVVMKSVDEQTKLGNFTMEIRNVSADDIGSVGCEYSSHQTDSVLIRFHRRLDKVRTSYQAPGSRIHTLQDGRKYVVVEEQINMTCHADDVRPPPVITWLWRRVDGSGGEMKKFMTDIPDDMHDNKVHNFSSTVQMSEATVRQLITSLQKTDSVTAAPSTSAATIMTARVAETNAITASLPSALFEEQYESLDEQIEVICSVEQLGTIIRKNFNLHFGSANSGARRAVFSSSFFAASVFLFAFTYAC